MLAGKRDSRRHSTATFNENVVVAEKKLSNVRSFIILRSGEGLPSFNKENSANVSGEKKKYNKAFWNVYYSRVNFQSYLFLVVVLLLESKGLY